MKKTSIWLENMTNDINESLKNDIEIDILIIGGGMTGLSTAYHLKESNLKVILVERNQIGYGVTSRTTGKLTFLQETIYQQINNLEKAKLYLESQREAIKLVEKIIAKNNINCDYERVESYLFTQTDKNKVMKEKEILELCGIKVKEVTKLPNNLDVEYGISVSNTAVFHPLKYLMGLKNSIQQNINIYENTKITDIKLENDYYICKANDYTIKAKKVVVATHYPYFLLPFMMPLKCHLEKSYVAAFKENNYHFSAINTDKETVSIRYYQDDNETYQLYLNGSHNIAFKNDEKENFNSLKNAINCEPDYIWSNKDIITNDFLPFIGRLEENLFIGTGYNTWGMTNGSLAGKILSDMVLEKENKYEELFNPKRSINIPKIVNYPVDIVSNVKSLVGNKLVKNKSWYANNIKFEKRDGEDVAIYIDEEKKEHIVYQKCPHFKCTLTFNEEEKTWDCPCHGSRFDIDGKCIEGPSNYNITYKDI